MAAQFLWFQGLLEILDILRGMNANQLDGQAVEQFSRVSPALRSGDLGSLRVGNAVAVPRKALIARLKQTGSERREHGLLRFRTRSLIIRSD